MNDTASPTPKDGPLVTYLISTYNRPRYLAEALASAVAQTYRNLQIIVVRDGGEEVRDVVESCNDPRVRLIDRAENRGLSYSYNEALQYAEGKYLAYLGDDDTHYPRHIASLVDRLEGTTDCQAAYSDLYCIVCHIEPDGRRRVLGKSCVVSRDYDWWYQIQCNSAPGGSTLHRRDLLDRTGPFDESLDVMIDWDMARRIGFFTDFEHVTDITGEFYTQVMQQDSDRISDRGRRSKRDFSDGCFRIVWSRPPKPWTKVKDLSIIFLADRIEPRSLAQIATMLEKTYTPYLMYLPLLAGELDKFDNEYPTIRPVPVSAKYSQGSRVDAALKRCEGDFVAVVPQGLPIRPYWVENPLYALQQSGRAREAAVLQDANRDHWAVMLSKRDLVRARKRHPTASVRRGLEKAGVRMRTLAADELPLLMDRAIEDADTCLKTEDYYHAGEKYDAIPAVEGNTLMLKARAAWAFYKDGSCDERALGLCRSVNAYRPIVDTLLLEAKLHRRLGNLHEATRLFESVRDMIQGSEPCYQNHSS
jgi:glycosyltransferase involved in cell wall biosynthesis